MNNNKSSNGYMLGAMTWPKAEQKFSEDDGIMGHPSKGNAEKGKNVETDIDYLVILVEELKRMTLDEIYDRRY